MFLRRFAPSLLEDLRLPRTGAHCHAFFTRQATEGCVRRPYSTTLLRRQPRCTLESLASGSEVERRGRTMRVSSGARAAVASALAFGLFACEDHEATGPDLAVTCSASPPSGTAPLAVAFTLDVSGVSSFQVSITYGDGATSASLNLVHVYESPGAYTAIFSVSSGGRSATCSTGVIASAGSAPSPSPTPGVNQPPNPVFKTTPKPEPGGVFTGRAPYTILFSMCASSDVDHDELFWTMDFEGDGKNEVHGSTGGSCRREHTYAAGDYRPRICVTDLDTAGKPRHDFQCKVYEVRATP